MEQQNNASIESHGASVGEHLPWPGLRLRYYLHWWRFPGTLLEQSQSRGRRGAKVPSVSRKRKKKVSVGGLSIERDEAKDRPAKRV